LSPPQARKKIHSHHRAIVALATYNPPNSMHNYDILGARMLWKPKEARILKNFIEF